MRRLFLLTLIFLTAGVSHLYSGEYGIKGGYLYIGEYDFQGDLTGIRDDSNGIIYGFESFSQILPILALNFEVGYTKNAEDIDFGPDIDSSYETRITPVSLNLLLTFGSDILQIYGGAGVGGYYVRSNFSLNSPDLDISGSESKWFWGYQVKGGLKFWLSENFGLYAEYQYRRFGEDMEYNTDLVDLRHDDDVILSQICGGILFTF